MKTIKIKTNGVLLGATAIFILTAGMLRAGEKVVARVNQAKIPESAFIAEINRQLPYASYHANVSREKYHEIEQKALNRLITQELLYQEALRQKLQVPRQKIREQIEVMKKGFKTEADFHQALKQTGMRLQDLEKRIERKLLIEALLKKEVYDKVHITDQMLRDYYEQNKHKFVLPEQYKVRHILISVDPGALKAGWLEGLKKAETVYKRLLLGEDFARLAEEVSDDTTSNHQGGELGWFHKGQLIAPLENALTKLKIGEISSPIRSIYGYHIIRLEGIRPQKQLRFDEIDRQLLLKRLEKREVEARKDSLVARLKAQADIQIYLD